MLVSVSLAVVAIYLLWLWFTRDKRLEAIPGPKGIPILGVSLRMRPMENLHNIVASWTRQYGPVMRLPILTPHTVVVSGYDAIYEVTVKKGMAFGGRHFGFRAEVALQKTGILTSMEPDHTWSSLRKTSHRHLRQFGDGLSRLESVIQDVGDDMFKDFTAHANTSYDPKRVIFDTALNSIAFLITGQRTAVDDDIVNKMRDYEGQALKYLSPLAPLSYLIIDLLPWLRHFRIEIWQKIVELIKFEGEIWSDIKAMNAANPDSESLCKVLMAECSGLGNDGNVAVDEISRGDVTFTEKDALRTSINLLFAGVTTTSNTFYGAINILAHNPGIQDAMREEIHSTCPGRLPTLPDRPKMPYNKAFLFELLRYTSVVPVGVPHRALQDDTIQGYMIPKDTQVVVNAWSLHHDPDFWNDPETFSPERFLDANGELVPADHPNRKHLMPFGAGLRVCLGESLALARLFLWITNVVWSFNITPAEGNGPSTTDATNFRFDGILRPTPYEVIFQPRELSAV